jgi:hypothetical protein
MIFAAQEKVWREFPETGFNVIPDEGVGELLARDPANRLKREVG